MLPSVAHTCFTLGVACGVADMEALPLENPLQWFWNRAEDPFEQTPRLSGSVTLAPSSASPKCGPHENQLGVVTGQPDPLGAEPRNAHFSKRLDDARTH